MLAFILAAALASFPFGQGSDGLRTTNCDNILSPYPTEQHVQSITSAQLARLRDFGKTYIWQDDQSPIGISPDGKSLAVQLRQADPNNNRYCQGLVVVPLDRTRSPRIIDSGGDIILGVMDLRSMRFPVGIPVMNQPRWSPDGSRIAYLKRSDRNVQIWIVDADGKTSNAVSPPTKDVERFAWLGDGRSLVFSALDAVHASENMRQQEGEKGFLYDDRFRPVADNKPFTPWSLQSPIFVLDLVTQHIRPAFPHESAFLEPKLPNRPAEAQLFAAGATQIAWTQRRDPGSMSSPVDLHGRDKAGHLVTCAAPNCSHVVQLWWSSATTSFVFLRRQGWGLADMGLYRWSPGLGRPVKILSGSTILLGCQLAQSDLICARESSNRPRDIVGVSLKTGKTRILFNPNPEFATIRKGSVRRLKWRNNLGIETFGDLVVPPGYDHKTPLPLIVVQYESRGFLRGGTGDEYPIFPLAAQGFAVLSFQSPKSYGDFIGSRTLADLFRVEEQNFNERRNLLSALSVGVEKLISDGIADRARIGITGLSDGVSTTQFALLNSQLFSAAAISTCCEDPFLQVLVGGPATQKEREDVMGRPRLQDEFRTFWQPYSLALNAPRISTPILMQLADTEYVSGLATYGFLRAAHKPVEMYVFPNERHIKWQPAHRLAIYDRAIDWFNFWLLAKEDPDKKKAAQYLRWNSLKTELSLYRATAGPPASQPLVQASASTKVSRRK